jgi:hypothetical protein
VRLGGKAMRCENCRADLIPTGRRGRPRRFCAQCLPPIAEIGKNAYHALYKRLVTGEPSERDPRAV